MSSVSGLQNLRFALGASADDEQSVHFVMAEIGANDVTFEDSITGTVTIGTITPGSHAHCAMEVMEGMQLVWIDRSERDDWGNAAGATDALNMGCELADVEGDGQGGRTKVLLRRQEPQPMNMGYAMKPPRIVYPAMTDAQIDFLVREIEKPGRLGADAAHRSMEAKFQDKALVLERQRIDSFISRYLQMVAGTIDFTAQVRASRGRTGAGAAVGDSGSDSDDSSNASDSGGGDSDGVTDYGGEFGTGIRSQPSERQCLEPKINTGAGIMIGTVVVAWQMRTNHTSSQPSGAKARSLSTTRGRSVLSGTSPRTRELGRSCTRRSRSIGIATAPQGTGLWLVVTAAIAAARRAATATSAVAVAVAQRSRRLRREAQRLLLRRAPRAALTDRSQLTSDLLRTITRISGTCADSHSSLDLHYWSVVP